MENETPYGQNKDGCNLTLNVSAYQILITSRGSQRGDNNSDVRWMYANKGEDTKLKMLNHVNTIVKSKNALMTNSI